MSGIIGITLADEFIDLDLLAIATNTLRHRGLDDEGYLLVNTVTFDAQERKGNNAPDDLKLQHISEPSGKKYNLCFGQRRSATIERLSCGHQPMSYDDKNLWIILDGPVYNFVELRNELQGKGYQFESDTDTEAVVASYKEWGYDCVNHFNGDWSLCIYDKKNSKLFLSRDRFGARPLYYYLDDKIFAFASEIKALFKFPGILKQPNPDALYEFLAFSLSDHSSETMFRNIYQLKPAHNLIFDINTKKISHASYYKLSYNSNFGSYKHSKALVYADYLRGVLIDSVKLRLRADVAVGLSLSNGGLDSSSIAGIINKIYKNSDSNIQNQIPLKTFTNLWPDSKLKYCDLVNEYTNSNGHYIYIDYAHFNTRMKDFSYYMDGLFPNRSIYAGYGLVKEASKYVKVILEGVGSDSIFVGKEPHLKNVYLAQLAKEIKIASFINEFLSLIETKSFDCFKKTSIGQIKKVIFLLIAEGNKNKLLRKSYKKAIKEAGELLKLKKNNIPREIIEKYIPNINSVSCLSQTKFPLPRMLHILDRYTTISSLESRAPFLDYRLVDYVLNIPACYKIRNGWDKWLLRLAMDGLLPEKIRWLKQGCVPASPKTDYEGYLNFRFFRFANCNLFEKD